MKRLRDMSNKELSIIEYITLIICIIGLIVDVGIIIENIVWYDDYRPAVILLASLAIACAIYAIINKIKRDKRLKKRKYNKKGE